MIEQSIDQVSRADIVGLVHRSASEGRTLEFKRDLPGNTDAEVKEFLADVTSLANTHGGDLLFGIDEVNGIAKGIQAIPSVNNDAGMLRLENLLRDGIEPRLPGVRLRWIDTQADGGVLLLRVPGSVGGPHRVRFKNSGRFYARNSRGKYEMDTFELRLAFAASEQLPSRLRAFHSEAVDSAHDGNLPIRLVEGPTAVATILPLGYLRETRALAVTREIALLPPNSGGGFQFLHTLEGVLAHTPILPAPEVPYATVRGYALTHWRGRTDAGWTIGGKTEADRQTRHLVWPQRFEGGLIDVARSTKAKLRALGVEGPWVVMVTVSGIKEFELVLSDHETSQPAWRRGAMLPELVLDELDGSSMAPIFHAFWLLFGELRPESRPA